MNAGYWSPGSIRGIPVRVHWTTPIGAFFFTGWSLEPLAWAGFVVLILVHELGHAALMRRYGHRVQGIDVTGWGGVCRGVGAFTPWQRAVVAWGGVLAQAGLLLVALGALALLGQGGASAVLAPVLVGMNLRLIAFNLLPLPPLDGAEAWPLLPMAWRRWRSARERRVRSARFAERVASERAAADAAFDARAPAPAPRSSPKPLGEPHFDPRAATALADILRGVGDEAGRATRSSKTSKR